MLTVRQTAWALIDLEVLSHRRSFKATEFVRRLYTLQSALFISSESHTGCARIQGSPLRFEVHWHWSKSCSQIVLERC